MTDAEQHLWRHLRMRQVYGLKFRRQHPCGRFILDFACVEIKLAMELDGGQHFENAEKDTARTRWLESLGWKLLRFWNNEVFENMEAVLVVIAENCNPHPRTKPINGAGSNLPPKIGKE